MCRAYPLPPNIHMTDRDSAPPSRTAPMIRSLSAGDHAAWCSSSPQSRMSRLLFHCAVISSSTSSSRFSPMTVVGAPAKSAVRPAQ